MAASSDGPMFPSVVESKVLQYLISSTLGLCVASSRTAARVRSYAGRGANARVPAPITAAS